MNYGGIFDYPGKRDRLQEVVGLLEDPAVWNDAKRAQDLGRERKELEGVVLSLDGIGQGLADHRELFELARMEEDDDTLESVEADVAGLEKQVAGLEFRRMFSGEMDAANCFVDIQSGSGGTEAQDWAGMLERMYVRYGERRGFKVEVLEESEGEVAGLKSAALKISGEYAYGYLRTETGVHRLVRKSPFDSNARRHTSFARCSSTPRSTTPSRSTSTPPTCASTPSAPAAPAASTSTRPTRRCASPTCPPASSCSARTTAPSTRTRPRPCPC
jgi:peptide chain release factor 2